MGGSAGEAGGGGGGAGGGGGMDRRRFFRAGLRQLLAKVDEATQPVQRFAKEMAKLDGPAVEPAGPSKAASRPVTLALPLRPPGALTEEAFLSACTRCGECVKACPVGAIVTDAAVASGAPYIVAERQPCTLCASLACMPACPTGALTFVPRAQIRMGRAHWGAGKCLRSGGELCTLCVEACPVGTAALDVGADGEIEVHEACTGCGVCQWVCPTTPRAIVVTPLRRGGVQAAASM